MNERTYCVFKIENIEVLTIDDSTYNLLSLSFKLVGHKISNLKILQKLSNTQKNPIAKLDLL